MLEVLLRHIFRHLSYNFDDRVRIRCLEHVEEAFTEAELLEVMRTKQPKMFQANRDSMATDVGQSQDSKPSGSSDLFAGMMLGIGAGGNMLAEKQKRLAAKTAKVEKIQAKRLMIKPFFYSNSFVKMNPLKELENMKGQSQLPHTKTR